MARRVYRSVIVAALAAAVGCSGSRTILRGQDPDEQGAATKLAAAPPPGVEWWRNPRWKPKPKKGGWRDPLYRREKYAETLLLAGMIPLALFAAMVSDESGDDWDDELPWTKPHHKQRVPEAPEKER